MTLNIVRGRIVGRITSDVGFALPLIHPYIFDEHLRRELHSAQIDRLPIR